MVSPSSGRTWLCLRAQQLRCLPIGGVRGAGSDRRVAGGFLEGEPILQGRPAVAVAFFEDRRDFTLAGAFCCAIWSSASSIAVVTMTSSDVQEVDASKGIYAVCGQLWSVGPRYRLQAHVGSGSYGDVCRALDLEFGQIIALKRVPDVFFCQMLAKRVLREVCIMRRLIHPYIISLTDVFVAKNLEKGDSTDLYIATEFAERGDLYHQVEPLTGDVVRILIWQLLVAVHYMHSCHVWHRDIKSENVLLTANLQVKLCDFGLSRSSLETSPYMDTKSTAVKSKRKPVLTRQYTKTVVTPSHRAPEVVMSQGQYSSAIDVWSVGCIFWELLMRQSRPHQRGPPAKPLFGVRGEPNTPLVGESYNNDITSELHEQMDVIFDVIGTPCWKDIESVPGEHWRAYLKKVPGRAGNVVKQLSGFVEDDALDLLQRMLAFAPQRRCTADEALLHTYFKGMNKTFENPPLPLGRRGPAELPDHPVWKISEPAVALGLLERELEMSTNHQDGGKLKLEKLLQCEVEQQQAKTELHRMTLRNLATKGMFNGTMRSMLPGPAVVVQKQPLREMQLFPCATSRADDLSTGSMSNSQSEPWTLGEMQDQGDWQAQGGMTRGSNGSDLSHETGSPCGEFLGQVNLSAMANGAANHEDDERPPAKRQRKMMIRQGSLCIEVNRGPEDHDRQGDKINTEKSSAIHSGQRTRKAKVES